MLLGQLLTGPHAPMDSELERSSWFRIVTPTIVINDDGHNDDHEDDIFDKGDHDDNGNGVTGVLPMGNWTGGTSFKLWSLEIEVIREAPAKKNHVYLGIAQIAI